LRSFLSDWWEAAEKTRPGALESKKRLQGRAIYILGHSSLGLCPGF